TAVELTAESVTEAAIDSTPAETAAEPIVDNVVAESVEDVAAESVAQDHDEPASEPSVVVTEAASDVAPEIVEPVVESAAEPVVEPIAETEDVPIARPVARSVASDVIVPASEPIAVVVDKSAAESSPETVAEPVVEDEADPANAAAEVVTETVPEPVVESAIEPVAEPVEVDTAAEPIARLATSDVVAPENGLSAEAIAVGATLTAVGGIAAVAMTVDTHGQPAEPSTPTTAVPAAAQAEVSDRDIQATHAMSSATLTANDSSPVTPSYVMHYPESLFGDTASVTPGLITMDDLHAAQKASAVVGVSAVSATSTGRRSRDSGFQTDPDASVGQRMRRFISGRRADTASNAREARALSPTRVFADTKDKLVSQYRASRSSQDSKRGSGAPTMVEDEERQGSIPGSYPVTSAPQSANVSDGEQPVEESAGEDEEAKDKHRRHTIMG
ncbi:hypothetical protein GGF47_005060, partial [Coemansia sp. RSA 2524]